jgi:outer membrane lipoprotein-sorting protein
MVMGQNHKIALFSLVVATLICFLSPLDSMALSTDDDKGVNSFLSAIEQKARSVKTLSCQFEQTRHLSIFNKPVRFQGNVAIDRPSKLRWEITKPIASVMAFSGEKGLHCRGKEPPRKFDLSTDPIMKIVADQLFNWLSGDYVALREKYTISLSGNLGIILIPKDPGVTRIISSIQVEFEPSSLQPIQVIITESGQDRTEIRFSDYSLNQPLTDDLFTKCYNQ